MSKQRETETMLGPLRVLDLTDDKGFYCGKVLGDLGADVIKIEPPGGDPARNIGPFYKDIPDPEKSLYWWAYNTSKRGITLSIETADGREIFKRLVKSADVVLGSFAPGHMDKLGLGYPVLSKINPGLVMTFITPFGQTGPYRDWKGPDIVGICLSGQAYVMGDQERSPCRISFPQAYLHASVHAAVGTLAAIRYRELTGEGQYVDVSMQDAMFWTAQGVVQTWELLKINLVRGGTRGKFGPFISRFGFPCKDGDVGFMIGGGILAAISMPAMTKWLAEEGMLGAFEPMKDWGYDEWLMRDVFAISQEEVDYEEDTLRRFFATKTRTELYQEALRRRIILCPSSTTKDLAENEQLREREFYLEVEHNELGGTVTYVGAPYKITETPWNISRRAPLVGEHNEEIYEHELGLSREEIRLLKEAGVI
jgi:benzylsuccinate CoA-transferase BbsE subunit/naphthyl-2-methylsuccinate CoA transferase subunit